MAKYHTLIVRDNPNDTWGAHFGDYDLEAVKDERYEITQWEYRMRDTKILTTASDDQATIDAAIGNLNNPRTGTIG